MLKPYTKRQTNDTTDSDSTNEENTTKTYESSFACYFINEQKEDATEEQILTPTNVSSNNWESISINKNLKTDRDKLTTVIKKKHKKIFSDKPGRTALIKHKISLISEIPVTVKPYPIAIHYRDRLMKEITELEQYGITRKSNSKYSSPLICIKKKDDTLRISIDYRKINALTILYAEPMANIDDLIDGMSNSNFFFKTKIDLTKGYWQIPTDKKSIHITAFATPLGLYEWQYLPFGLQNAPSTFMKIMRKLLEGIEHVSSYMDDICVHSRTIDDHTKILDQVFQRIKIHAKLAKIQVGYTEINFLGHVITDGFRKTDTQIVIKNFGN